MSFNADLQELLLTNPKFMDEDGELLLAAVQDAAWKIDRDLVKLLLSKKEIKAKFFDEIEGHWIFNLNTFLEYISQKNFLDNSYTRFRNRIGLTIDGKYLRERGEVALAWPYKDCYLEGGQTKEEEKREEIFFNEILAQDEINRLLDPKVLTHFKRYAARPVIASRAAAKQSTRKGEIASPSSRSDIEVVEEKVTDFRRDENGVIRENLIIKGNNLLALHTLKTQFRGRVKLIYIDPPYNTGNDSFGYNDNFNHSTWLTFMKNRLEVAREFLSEDGFIFIQCDDYENAYLRILMDDIFGKENYRNSIYWHRTYAGKTVSKNLPWNVDAILLYSKRETVNLNATTSDLTEKDIKSFNKDDNDGRGFYNTVSLQKTGGPGPETTYDYVDNDGKVWQCPAKGWRMKKSKLKALENDNRLYITETTIREKYYLNERLEIGKQIDNFWGDIGNMNRNSDVSYGLSGQKPEKLIERIIGLATSENDIVLDFFLGSGTTVAVAHKMGRQYIGIEQMDYIETIPVERLKKVIAGEQGGISKSVNWQGGGDFIYCELMKYNEAFMERVQAAQDSEDLLDIWQDMTKDSFLNWYVNPAMPEEAIKDFEAIGDLEKQKHLLAELLDKNQLYVNLSEIDDAQFKVSKEDKALNQAFYGNGGGAAG